MVFPTTVWTLIHDAHGDRAALEEFASHYRAPVLAFIRGKGVAPADADDLCQDVFVRLLEKDVLRKADPGRGRFRALLLTVTSRIVIDWRRKRRREVAWRDLEPVDQEPDFDEAWALHLTERGLQKLEQESPRAFAVLTAHLEGERPDRRRLYTARRKLVAAIRQEIAVTCRSRDQLEDEVAYLEPYFRPRKKRDNPRPSPNG